MNNIFQLNCNCSFVGSANKDIEICFYKTGVLVPGSIVKVTTSAGGSFQDASLFSLINLVNGDDIQVRVRNVTSSTNLTISHLSVFLHSIT